MDYEKAYKEALERAKVAQETYFNLGNITAKTVIETIFPELRESEDEKIRKELIAFLERKQLIPTETKNEWIAWLEKEGKQSNNEDLNILQRFSFYSYKDEPNILYLSGLYVNEECRNKGMGTKILEVADEVAKSLNCHAIRLKTKKDSNAERLYRTLGYNSLPTEERDEIWLEKQSEKSVCKVKIGETYKCIASPRYICFRKGDIYHVKDNFVAELINICSDCFVLLEKQDDQKPTDKGEPKFKVGDWIVKQYLSYPFIIIDIKNDSYILNDIEGNKYEETIDFANRVFHLWTIKDAKDGDVLAEHETIVLFKKIEGQNIRCYCTYHYLGFNPTFYVGTLQNKNSYYPATKEQHNLLLQKMKEAGYEWDAEKKELKMIENTSNMTEALRTEYGKGRADAIAEMKTIEWSEEDEEILNNIITAFKRIGENCEHYFSPDTAKVFEKTLKSLKDRVQSQPKQEWSEEDKEMLYNCLGLIQEIDCTQEEQNWLKSLIKPQNRWKPSEQNIKDLEWCADLVKDKMGVGFHRLQVFIDDLKKL